MYMAGCKGTREELTREELFMLLITLHASGRLAKPLEKSTSEREEREREKRERGYDNQFVYVIYRVRPVLNILLHDFLVHIQL